MAAPTFVAASAGTTDATGAWTHTSAAPGAAGRILIVQALQDGTAADISITSVTNAEDLAGTDNVLTKIGEFDVGSAVAASQHLWIGRSLSTSAMVITGANAGGDDVYVRVYEFQNGNVGTTINDVIENGSAGATVNTAGTAVSIQDSAVTTLGVDRLALQFIAANDDIGIPDNSELTWLQVVAEYADAGGTDGMIACHSAAAATAATYGGDDTWTGSLSSAWGVVGFALIGTTAAGPAIQLRDSLHIMQAVNRSNVY